MDMDRVRDGGREWREGTVQCAHCLVWEITRNFSNRTAIGQFYRSMLVLTIKNSRRTCRFCYEKGAPVKFLSAPHSLIRAPEDV